MILKTKYDKKLIKNNENDIKCKLRKLFKNYKFINLILFIKLTFLINSQIY